MKYYNENSWTRREIKPVVNQMPYDVSGQSTFLKLFMSAIQPFLTEVAKKNIRIRVARSDDHTSAELVFMDSHDNN